MNMTQTLLDDLAPPEPAEDSITAMAWLATAGALILMADGMQRMMGLVNSYG